MNGARTNILNAPVNWRLRTRCLEIRRRPLVMGIVNVTPDSFSDGGRWSRPDHAVAHALQLAADGADLLDVGGESTRPGSEPVSLAQELDRVAPVIEALCRETDVPVSVDTSKAAVARVAIEYGAEIINDVTALEGDPEMIAVAVETGAGICAMHMQGSPQTMQDNPQYHDVVGEVREYLASRRDGLIAAAVNREQICLDPGIGFGKTHAHNIELLRGVDRFLDLGCPILVGHSRKGFIRKLTGDQSREQIAGTLAVSLHLARCGVHVLRVHDVQHTRQALAAWWPLQGTEDSGV